MLARQWWREFLCEFEASLVYRVPGLSGLFHRETMPRQDKKKKKVLVWEKRLTTGNQLCKVKENSDCSHWEECNSVQKLRDGRI